LALRAQEGAPVSGCSRAGSIAAVVDTAGQDRRRTRFAAAQSGISALGRIREKEVETMAKDHGSSVKDDEQYEALRREGASKEKAARIANADRSQTGKKGGKSSKYGDWSKQDLQEKAKEVGIEGRSKMDKAELIDALRNH